MYQHPIQLHQIHSLLEGFSFLQLKDKIAIFSQEVIVEEYPKALGYFASREVFFCFVLFVCLFVILFVFMCRLWVSESLSEG